MPRALGSKNLPGTGQTVPFYVRGVHARCPSCGGGFDRKMLILRPGNTRGRAICGECYIGEGPDGYLERRSV